MSSSSCLQCSYYTHKCTYRKSYMYKFIISHTKSWSDTCLFCQYKLTSLGARPVDAWTERPDFVPLETESSSLYISYMHFNPGETGTEISERHLRSINSKMTHDYLKIHKHITTRKHTVGSLMKDHTPWDRTLHKRPPSMRLYPTQETALHETVPYTRDHPPWDRTLHERPPSMRPYPTQETALHQGFR